MIRDKKEMLNFEEVDKIETFFGLNKGMILGRELIESEWNLNLQNQELLPLLSWELIES